MKENTNPHHVVMAREMYDMLIALAGVAAVQLEHPPQVLAKIKRHVRKYNTALRVERQNEVMGETQLRLHYQRKAKDLMKNHQGKEIICSFKMLKEPVVLVGHSLTDKTKLRVYRLADGEIYEVHGTRITITTNNQIAVV